MKTVEPNIEKAQEERGRTSSNVNSESSNSRFQWRNAEGERLADFGVDDENEEGLEDVDADVDAFHAATTTHGSSIKSPKTDNKNETEAEDDNVPLALLVQRRKIQVV